MGMAARQWNRHSHTKREQHEADDFFQNARLKKRRLIDRHFQSEEQSSEPKQAQTVANGPLKAKKRRLARRGAFGDEGADRRHVVWLESVGEAQTQRAQPK